MGNFFPYNAYPSAVMLNKTSGKSMGWLDC
ncbi:hypothetical protein SAMN05421643_1311 [Acinetobacter kyonggiensis]|uniref:Uncharacterized protein n=1 Tax=Acinetobacter kyonggiensis TaxID=595670 RepID=A0A1H3MSN8_9GAMM|nr:hypothetical protein SAMN05421643_1311 [Acinetobacter kyonggiensis]